MVFAMQKQIAKMNENLGNLIGRIRAANQERFGCHMEKMSEPDGQLSFFNEAEYYSEDAGEPESEEVLPQEKRNKKQKSKREADLKDFPEEMHDHDVAEKQLNGVFGEGNWREMPAEEYKRLRYEPASLTVENHKVHVYLGTDGSHQDEFLRGDRPKDLLRNSILTPSLGAAIMNAKYVNSLPLYRIEKEFQRNGVNLSRQTMANWVMRCSERYFSPLYDYLRTKLLEYHVTQADEPPAEVIHDGRSAGSKTYMWVHHSREMYTDRPIFLYEYQKTINSEHLLKFYKDFRGKLITVGLEQYHKVGRELAGVINANCWAYARRDYADAVKAMGKSNPEAVKQATACQALSRLFTRAIILLIISLLKAKHIAMPKIILKTSI